MWLFDQLRLGILSILHLRLAYEVILLYYPVCVATVAVTTMHIKLEEVPGSSRSQPVGSYFILPVLK